MEIKFAGRMEDFQPGIFNVLDNRKNERLAQGKMVFNLSIGTPDFLPEPHIVEALAQAASDPDNYRYSLGETPELTQAVQGWYRRRYGVELATDELMAVYGSQEGLTHIGWALCDPGDVVLVPDPGYPIFELGPSAFTIRCCRRIIICRIWSALTLFWRKRPGSWWCPILLILWVWRRRMISIPGSLPSRKSTISLSSMTMPTRTLFLTGG